MHPARSLILFTTLSGLGFGLMLYLGLGLPAVTGWQAFAFYLVAFALAGAGLASSALHLGHPERALKAFTQWRSSWLSREAWLAAATLAVNGVFAFAAVVFGVRLGVLGALGAALALATVFSTSMIYAQLKTVPRWHQPLTPAVFLALSFAGGALLAGQFRSAAILLLAAAVVQLAAWRLGDARLIESGTTLGTATGLGDLGKVRSFEPPHTGGNYLTHEMIFVLGRKHATKLRAIGFALAFVLPVLALLPPLPLIFAVLAVLSHIAGVVVLRWLFFAEAEHVVGVYYGKRTA